MLSNKSEIRNISEGTEFVFRNSLNKYQLMQSAFFLYLFHFMIILIPDFNQLKSGFFSLKLYHIITRKKEITKLNLSKLDLT